MTAHEALALGAAAERVALARRLRVLRAVVALHDHAYATVDNGGVLAFHVRWFGIEECVKEPLPKIKRDLAWLEHQGYATKLRGGVGTRPAEYAPTALGRAWADRRGA